MARRWSRVNSAVLALTIAFAAVLTLWASLTPAFKAPDEAAHFSSVERMATAPAWPDPGEARMSGAVKAAFAERTLPASERSTLGELAAENPGLSDSLDWMTQHPPGYYAVVGAVMNVLGIDNMRWDVALFVIRLISVLIVASLPVFLFKTIRNLTGSPRAGVVAAAMPLLVPQLQQIGSSASNDSVIILGGAVIVWLASRVLVGKRDWPTFVGMGLTLAILAFTKGTGLPAVPFALLVVLFTTVNAPSLRLRIGQTAAVLGIACAGLWWWGLNLIRFHTLQPSATRGVRPDNPWPEGSGPDALHYLNAMWNGISQSFWGNFGGLDIPLPSILPDVLTVGILLLVIGYAFRGTDRRRGLLLASYPIVVLALLGYTTWQVYDRTQSVFGVQGRYFFGALVALVALAALALLRYQREEKDRLRWARGLVTAAPAVSLVGVLIAYMGFYEAGLLHIGRNGLSTWATTSPVGIVGIVVLTVAVAVAFVVATRLARRVVGERLAV
ncbi:hypothetical protein BH11ACT5_BH11ACT5_15070 [soil metagenome]